MILTRVTNLKRQNLEMPLRYMGEQTRYNASYSVSFAGVRRCWRSMRRARIFSSYITVFLSFPRAIFGTVPRVRRAAYRPARDRMYSSITTHRAVPDILRSGKSLFPDSTAPQGRLRGTGVRLSLYSRRTRRALYTYRSCNAVRILNRSCVFLLNYDIQIVTHRI